MLVMAKTKKRVPYADESSDEAREDLEALIKEAIGEGEETENASNSMSDMKVTFDKVFAVLCSFSCIVLPQIIIIIIILFLTQKFCVFACVCPQQEVKLTDEEVAIKAYLSDGEPLTPEILNKLIAPYWKQEPYM